MNGGILQSKYGVCPQEPPIESLYALVFLNFGEALSSIQVVPLPLGLSRNADVDDLQGVSSQVGQRRQPEVQRPQSIATLVLAQLGGLHRAIQNPYFGDEGHEPSKIAGEPRVRGYRLVSASVPVMDWAWAMRPSE